MMQGNLKHMLKKVCHFCSSSPDIIVYTKHGWVITRLYFLVTTPDQELSYDSTFVGIASSGEFSEFASPGQFSDF